MPVPLRVAYAPYFNVVAVQGNSMTSMLAALNPLPENADECFNTLQVGFKGTGSLFTWVSSGFMCTYICLMRRATSYQPHSYLLCVCSTKAPKLTRP